jgi:hypothetical protein
MTSPKIGQLKRELVRAGLLVAKYEDVCWLYILVPPVIISGGA